MGLEVATYINELQDFNPTGNDVKSQGDDHLRLIKGAIKRTFPNITGAMTLTQGQLNGLIEVGINNSPGMVQIWPYSIATIPAGWKLCNGTGTLRDGRAVPNMLDRFPVGAGGLYGILATGGTLSIATSVGVTVADTALTIAQMPPHTHAVTSYAGVNGGFPGINSQVGGSAGQLTGSAGSGAPHGHTVAVTQSTHSILNPYVGVLFIIKD